MQKKLGRKLFLSKETLRTLSARDLDEVRGLAYTTYTTGESNSVNTCESCVKCSMTVCTNCTCDG